MFYLFLTFILFLNFLIVPSVFAQCPVCIVTVGGGMLLADKLGVDDLIVSIWISGLNVAIAYWLAPKFKYKILKNPYLSIILLLASTLIYFQFTDQIGALSNRYLGIDKIIFGQILGTILVVGGHLLDQFIRHRNHNHVLFYYQKVILPLSLLIISTIIFLKLLG
jgi:hypothetical protein